MCCILRLDLNFLKALISCGSARSKSIGLYSNAGSEREGLYLEGMNLFFYPFLFYARAEMRAIFILPETYLRDHFLGHALIIIFILRAVPKEHFNYSIPA